MCAGFAADFFRLVGIMGNQRSQLLNGNSQVKLNAATVMVKLVFCHSFVTTVARFLQLDVIVIMTYLELCAGAHDSIESTMSVTREIE